jgi:glutathione S-transferase
MRRSSRFVPLRVVLLAALAAAAAWPLVSTDGRALAQETASPLPTAAVSSRLTRERLAALMEASNQQLNYVPGEVVVKFRDGVTVEGQQRALSGVRSQPSLADICLIPQMYNARRFNSDLSAVPRLVAIDERARTVPAFAKAAPEAQPDAG